MNSPVCLHHSRFTKHLNPDDISLSFLKGKGELKNLDLNADFITDVLRLPPWIRIKSVFCDQIKIEVPFTDLHKSPIRCVSDMRVCYML